MPRNHRGRSRQRRPSSSSRTRAPRTTLNALLLRLLKARFGPLPRALERRGANLADPEHLLALAEQAVEARSLAELRWPG